MDFVLVSHFLNLEPLIFEVRNFQLPNNRGSIPHPSSFRRRFPGSPG